MSADDEPGPIAWLGVLLLVLSGLLSGLLETLLVPLYVGTAVLPVSVILAVVGNVTLPALARTLVDRTWVAALPFVAWLVVIIGFGTVTRPEGDVILPGAPDGAKWVTYGLLVLGALAGAVTLFVQSTTRMQPGRATR